MDPGTIDRGFTVNASSMNTFLWSNILITTNSVDTNFFPKVTKCCQTSSTLRYCQSDSFLPWRTMSPCWQFLETYSPQHLHDMLCCCLFSKFKAIHFPKHFKTWSPWLPFPCELKRYFIIKKTFSDTTNAFLQPLKRKMDKKKLIFL
jgi:hypothetical protein